MRLRWLGTGSSKYAPGTGEDRQCILRGMGWLQRSAGGTSVSGGASHQRGGRGTSRRRLQMAQRFPSAEMSWLSSGEGELQDAPV